MHFRHYTGSEAAYNLRCSFFSLAGPNQYKLTPHFLKMANIDFGGNFGLTSRTRPAILDLKLSTDFAKMQYQTKQVFRL